MPEETLYGLQVENVTPGTSWSAERITELRQLAQDVVDATLNYIQSDSVDDLRALETARQAYRRQEPNAETVVSMLDELESARAAERSKNAELQLASEQVAACTAELENLRRE